MTTTSDSLKERAKALKLHGLLAHWDEVWEAQWIEPLIRWEEEERARRGLQRRLSSARLGRFKPLADFDWSWPKQCDRQAVEELMLLGFLDEPANAVLVGPNGVGKSTIARNIAHQAVLAGHSVLFTNAATMLNELAAQDGDHALRRRLALYARPRLLVIDEIGSLSATPICCSRSSRAATRRSPRSSPPTSPSPSGTRSFPTPPVSSPSSTVSSTTPRSSLSTVNPIASRRPRNAPRIGADNG